ncbi:MAG: translocation/assembly module TamB domain-containing protein [Chitinophagaceae bacterium]|nr:translocation/assembly module TamB domain-containing protein [Chitinophagaceae bacterium]MCW5914186.1 translocation/assembly module TamB domain-containing protein [Chitinophagaceae bacterium]MCZ2395108.1 translocation/assembly module TamB [Chitinophagales bacterium]
MPPVLKKILKILAKLALSLVVLLLVLWVLLQTSFFQNFLVHRLTNSLSKSLNTTVSIRKVDFSLFDRMSLEHTLILDHKQDTLLYAEAVRVSITDWFFLKKKSTLRYIGLQGATIKLNRDTPEWNYQFLEDYFGGGSSSGGGSAPPNIDLKLVSLKDVTLFQQDKWLGRDMLVSVKGFRLEADKLDIPNHLLQINSIDFDRPVFAQYDYKGLRPPKVKTDSSATEIPQSDEPLNSDNWRVISKLIKIKDGKIAIERESKTPSDPLVFDDRHVILSQLNATLKDTRVEKDTLTSEIDFSVKDRSGFTIKKLSSLFKMTPQSMEFSKLDAQTEHSRLGDYFAMHYNNFEDDMNDFVHAVRMEGNFKNAVISSEDLAYFAPETKAWKKNFTLNGEVTGKVENLTALGFTISAGTENFLAGDLSIRGLPEVNSTFMDLRIREMKTNYNELAGLIPSLRSFTQPDLSAFGKIRYIGSFTGYFNDFVTFGELSTDIGILSTDIHLKVPVNTTPVYSGSVATLGFNLGRFIKDSSVGFTAFKGSLKGKGFTENTMHVSFDGKIDRLNYGNYEYKNIITKGEIRKNAFSGSASIHDPNITIDTLSGTINLSDKSPFFNFYSDIRKIDLNALGFTKDTIAFRGKLEADFTGKNIDDFLGTAKLTEAILIDNGRQLPFDSLVINSSVYEENKLLSLKTNELEASINGNFKIRELPKAFQLFLNRYYPGYVKKPEGAIENQDFSFLVHTRNISEYISLIDSKMSGFNESVIQGSINIDKNLLQLKGEVPGLKYGGLAMNNISLNGSGNHDTLVFLSDIESLILNDSLRSADVKIEVTASQDISDILISSSTPTGLDAARLSAKVHTKEDGFQLAFNPSSFTIGDKLWRIEKGGEIELVNDLISAQNVRFYQDGQEVKISTQLSSLTNSNNVNISLKGIVVEDFLPFFLSYPKMQGQLTGEVQIFNPTKKSRISFSSTINDFRFENDSVGIINLSGFYNASGGNFTSNIISNNNPYNFSGSFNYTPQDSLNSLDGQFTLNQTEIALLSPFMEGILDNLKGNATGKLAITGTPENPNLEGSVTLRNTSLVIDYTKCKYRLVDGSVITFSPGEINFGLTKILDINNQSATLTGKIYHNFFDDFFFNELHVKTGRNFQLLNTTAKDNNEFYGKVKGQAELTLNGYTSDMRMNIKGESTDSSHIILPIGETVESGSLNYIDFKQFGREMTLDSRVRENTNIKVQMELTANSLAKIDVILDETTGDVIEARGSGKLFITAGTSDPLTIRGRYNVEQGEYTFNFQTVMKTPFTLEEGYIEWQGDPYLALLNIDALYKAKGVNLSNIPTSTGSSNTRGDIDILFKLRGTLKNPSPQFEFQFPFDNPLKSDPIASEYLKSRFQSDNDQLLNQVAALLLFNTFLTTDQGMASVNYTGNFVTKTVGQLLSNTLTTSLNSWLQKLLKWNNVNVYTNINATDFNFQKSIESGKIQNIGAFGFTTSLMKDKLIINVGGNVDFTGNPGLTTNTSNVLVTPDVSFEYLITPTGNLRVIGFNRSDTDPTNITGITKRNRTGVQLSYRRNFDTFEEFFTGQKKTMN